jgi:hypothetical protein
MPHSYGNRSQIERVAHCERASDCKALISEPVLEPLHKLPAYALDRRREIPKSVFPDFSHEPQTHDLAQRHGYLYDSHRHAEASSRLAFAISALPLTSLIFRFALPRLQKARALLGSSRIASL